LEQFQPGMPLYNIPAAARLRGRLDRAALRLVLQAIIDRHESLRTTFAVGEGGPVQVVAPALELPLAEEDLSALPEPERASELRRRAREEARRPFDLARGPLLRVALLRLGDEEHAVLLTLHHVAADGWSAGVFLRELAALYAAFSRGEPSPLPPLPVQYADYAAWQRDYLQGDVLEAQLTYWKGRLAGVPPLELPTDRPRPATPSPEGASLSVELPPELSARLKELARGGGATPFMVLLGAFQALLGRYSGQDEFAVGTPIAGRTRPEVQGLIGFFVNTLALRADLSGDPSFRALLARTKETALGAYAHQDVPFEKLVEELRPERDTSRSPLFQVMFTLQNVPMPQVSLPGLTITPLGGEGEAAKFDLSLGLAETPEGLRGTLFYRTALFDRRTMERFLEHYRLLLEAAAADPDRPLSRVPLVAGEESRRVLVEWNDTAADYPADLCLHQLFERQAARTPDAVALTGGDQSLTYAELDARAAALARRLRSLGVGPDVHVAVCAERSPEMVVALLAVLKAGSAYVPLDPAYPAQRIEYMLADSAAPVVLTQCRLVDRLPATSATVVCLDEEPALGDDLGDSGVRPDNLAYVIYTSGSTGKPKGVQISHRAIVNLLLSMCQKPGLSADDMLLAVTTISFDIAALELFGPLAVGARVALAGRDEAADPGRLADLLRTSGATVMQATPATWRMLLEGGWRGDTSLKALCGGEALPRDLARRLLPACGSLWNMYGPTETTVWSTCQRIDSATGAISIGRGIANTRMYVLDRHLQPVPAGVAGEVWIGGTGLARGYLNNPALTAEKFLPDPFSGEPGARMYRTGDRGRWLADGTLEHLGRLDAQVKVRGYRIELGEAEAALAAHTAIREAAAAVREDRAGGKRLVAYFVARDSALVPGADELRSHLRERLPEYMVPSAFVALDALPLTSNGKVDRKALPAPPAERPTAREYVAPRTPLEGYLAGLWEKELGVERVGVEDNFFELGGDSIKGAVLVNRVRDKLGEDVYAVALFDAPTVAKLARYLAAHRPEAVGHVFGPESVTQDMSTGDRDKLLVELRPGSGGPATFWVHPAGGLALAYQDLARHLGTGGPFFGFRARGLEEGQSADECVEDMAAAYVAALRQAQPEGPYVLGGWSMGGLVAYEMARQLVEQGQEVRRLFLLDTSLPGSGGEKHGADTESRLMALMAREHGLDVSAEELEQLPPPQRLSRLLERAQGQGLVPAGLPPEQLEPMVSRLLAVFTASLRAARDYRPKPYAGNVVLVRAGDAGADAASKLDWGWERLAGSVEVEWVPGTHHSLVREPHVRTLAQRLRPRLLPASQGVGR
jgi:amino acid adenylation domain-containing protein